MVLGGTLVVSGTADLEGRRCHHRGPAARRAAAPEDRRPDDTCTGSLETGRVHLFAGAGAHRRAEGTPSRTSRAARARPSAATDAAHSSESSSALLRAPSSRTGNFWHA